MNPVSDTECSSGGCESGWTLYLDHDSFLSHEYRCHKTGNEYYMSEEKRGKHQEFDDDDDDDEEDMSMVSDASSGPPHFQEDEDYGNEKSNSSFNHAPVSATLPKSNVKRQKKKEHRHQKLQEQQLSFLDDTATSSFFGFSSNNIAHNNNQASMETMLDYSQGHSTFHFQEKARVQEHYGFFQSPITGTQLPQNQWLEGRRWE